MTVDALNQIDKTIDTGKGITLVGEAAKSWVDLQWYKELIHDFFSLLVIVVAIYLVYKYKAEIKNFFKEFGED
jgi:hypothetical protein